MNCKLYRTKIEEMNFGERLNAETETHLRACRACADFYAERAALRGLIGDLERVNAPSDFDFRLRARIAAENASTGRSRAVWRFAPGLVSLAVAALFALTLVTLRVYQTQPPATNLAQMPDADVETRANNTTASVPTDNNVAALPAQPATTSLELAQASGATKETESVPRRRVRQSRFNEAALNSARMVNARAASPSSSDFTASLRGATVVSRESAELLRAASKGSMPVAVPVSTSAQPLRVVLRDEHGESRVVAIKSVSFGAQNLMGQRTRATSGNLPVREGVW